MKVKEFWHIDLSKSEIRNKDYPGIEKDEVLIKSQYSLISSGTERIVASGMVPDELMEIMKVPFMGGSFDFPVKYGYSLVGKVIEGKQSWIGKTVHLMHPHQDFVIVPESHLTLVPESIPHQRAVLASNLETAVNAVWDSNVSLGDKVLICGFGIIGALIALVVRQIPAVKIVVHETDPKRKQLASSMGFSIYEPNKSGLNQFDLAINTTASGEALQLCIDTTVPGSKIVEVSWYGRAPVIIRLGGSFHAGQKQIISSQVSAIPAKKQKHFDFKRRKQLVFNLLQNDVFDQLPFHVLKFDKLPELFEQIRNREYKQFATIVSY